MDTAPKDGTEVDLWARRAETDKYERVPGCSWSDMTDYLTGVERKGWSGLYVHPYRTYDSPTHWMPLPTPPTGKEGA